MLIYIGNGESNAQCYCENIVCLKLGSVTPDGSTLTLLRLSPEDSGTYTCLAASPAGQESKIYSLFVLGQFEHFMCVCLCLSVLKFLTDLFWFDLTCHSPSIDLW